MLLAIDAGNTHIKVGVYQGPQLLAKWRMIPKNFGPLDEYGTELLRMFERSGLDAKAIDAIIVASVVPRLNPALQLMAERYFQLKPRFVDHTTNTGLKLLYDQPSELGADRIVDAVGAVEKYGVPCIAIDFGTATTFNLVNSQREFLGGIIAPGLMTAAEALFSRAARLPRVEIARPEKLIGTSTVEAMQSGLFYGYASLVGGLIRRLMTGDMSASTVVATGGLAHLIQEASEFTYQIDENLTLDGLRIIHERA
jgi:type III pantothenate kinase